MFMTFAIKSKRKCVQVMREVPDRGQTVRVVPPFLVANLDRFEFEFVLAPLLLLA